MKNLPLSAQIGLVCTSAVAAVLLAVALLLPGLLSHFFTAQIFDMLEKSQNSLALVVPTAIPTVTLDAKSLTVAQAGTFPALSAVGEDYFSVGQVVKVADFNPTATDWATTTGASAQPVVGHLLLPDSTEFTAAPAALPQSFQVAVSADALAQQLPVQQYTRTIGSSTLFYVIRQEAVQGTTMHLVSYAWANYRNLLVDRLFRQLIILLLPLLCIGWLLSLWLARRLTRPLVQMETAVAGIARRDWNQPLAVRRGDEIGRLAAAFEQMRQQLVKQDRAQQAYLQHISHELKTPVMVIHSYTQAILDQVYPQGDLPASVQVINSEAERLEKRVRELISLTKLDYLAARATMVHFDLRALLSETVERLRWRRPEVQWQLPTSELSLFGDAEQWQIAWENLLDNQLRYAVSTVSVSALAGTAGLIRLRVWNDGPAIEATLLESLFQPFQMGESGEFGLGLTIVRRVTEEHGGTVSAANEDGGAAFYLTLPLNRLVK